MWIFTQIGFYSINRTPDGKKLQFRARKKEDLENLQANFPSEVAGAKIMTIAHADYRWRIELLPAKAAIILCALTEQIDYRNFKNHLHQTDQKDKLDILHDLWNAMFRYQTANEGGRKSEPFMAPWNHQGLGRQTKDWQQENEADLFPDFNPEQEEPEEEEPPSPAQAMLDTISRRQEIGEPITIREVAQKLGLSQGKAITFCESEGLTLNKGSRRTATGHSSPGDYTVEA